MTTVELKEKLVSEQHTCVAMTKSGLYTSEDRGVKPILAPLNQDASFFEGALVVDRVIGKSAALLLIKGKIQSLYALVLSEPALEVLKKTEIEVQYDELVPYIINRDKTGMCPMESSVLEVDDPEEAFVVLNAKVKELMGK